MEGAMQSINFWGRSLSRVELDQRAREARLRLERIERLFASRAAVRQPRLRRLVSVLSLGEYRGSPRERRARGPLSEQRPSRIPTIFRLCHPEAALP
jgi:hypothetical protein